MLERRNEAMFGRRNEEERERWYLLPAMQHGARRKFYQRLAVAVVVGSLTAALLALAIYQLNQRN
jgi:hypothetical protein